MDDLTAPEKWSLSVSIVPWWLAAVKVVNPASSVERVQGRISSGGGRRWPPGGRGGQVSVRPFPQKCFSQAGGEKDTTSLTVGPETVVTGDQETSEPAWSMFNSTPCCGENPVHLPPCAVERR
ncbi:unnamed protein product [Pleuronectes platessa]|uniref:Uncharacterized protein n=1 Tax=Pleuronectes platessa TaxID=8262 RepID=A0A9N7TTW7_PLEPL|nr:unnamed protein product [Pleuronectes platessa]